MRSASVSRVGITRISDVKAENRDDLVPVEEPLEIRLYYGPNGFREERSISITMRTPGHDLELAAGFLFSEGVIQSSGDILNIHHCETVRQEEKGNVVRVELSPDVNIPWDKLQRHFYTSSSCGVCGKTSIDLVSSLAEPLPVVVGLVTVSVLHSLPQALRADQTAFEYTGGLHASGLFATDGRLVLSREDVGRHNALDKVIGHSFMSRQLPLSDHVLLVSGRTSFELVQKAVRAGVPLLAAVGAPSSLAVELARASGLTLVGFLREGRFNTYTYPERITGATRK